MTLHDSTFEYLGPTAEQVEDMQVARQAFKRCAEAIDAILPEGPDKTHTLRIIRNAGMWANVAITRNPDGSPRV